MVSAAIGRSHSTASAQDVQWAVRRLLESLARSRPGGRLRRHPVGRAAAARPDPVPGELRAHRAGRDRLPGARRPARAPPRLGDGVRPRRDGAPAAALGHRLGPAPARAGGGRQGRAPAPVRDPGGRRGQSALPRASGGDAGRRRRQRASRRRASTRCWRRASTAAAAGAAGDRGGRGRGPRLPPRGRLAALLADEGAIDVDAALRELERRELVRPAQREFSGDEGYRFTHLLVRDAAYDLIPKRAAGGGARGLARWLRSVAAERRELERNHRATTSSRPGSCGHSSTRRARPRSGGRCRGRCARGGRPAGGRASGCGGGRQPPRPGHGRGGRRRSRRPAARARLSADGARRLRPRRHGDRPPGHRRRSGRRVRRHCPVSPGPGSRTPTMAWPRARSAQRRPWTCSPSAGTTAAWLEAGWRWPDITPRPAATRRRTAHSWRRSRRRGAPATAPRRCGSHPTSR